MSVLPYSGGPGEWNPLIPDDVVADCCICRAQPAPTCPKSAVFHELKRVELLGLNNISHCRRLWPLGSPGDLHLPKGMALNCPGGVTRPWCNMPRVDSEQQSRVITPGSAQQYLGIGDRPVGLKCPSQLQKSQPKPKSKPPQSLHKTGG